MWLGYAPMWLGCECECQATDIAWRRGMCECTQGLFDAQIVDILTGAKGLFDAQIVDILTGARTVRHTVMLEMNSVNMKGIAPPMLPLVTGK